jgi:mono/diheme cytochrome c family protein
MGEKEKIPDLSSRDWQKHNSDADIRRVIAEGSPQNHKMSAFKNRLTPADIDAQVKYIRSLQR